MSTNIFVDASNKFKLSIQPPQHYSYSVLTIVGDCTKVEIECTDEQLAQLKQAISDYLGGDEGE